MTEQQSQEQDFWAARDHAYPLPTLEDGYVRVLFVGTTGSGKTTLVRQFLGTHPDKKEYFPSASGGKTTTSAIEVITKQGPFQAVVSFLPKSYVRIHVEECILAAASVYWDGGSVKEAAKKFLEHEEQKFRLRYILGDFPLRARTNALLQQENDSEQREVSDSEAEEFARTIQKYLDTIQNLVASMREIIMQNVQSLADGSSEEEREVLFHEQLEKELRQQEMLSTLIDTIMVAVEQRFTLLLNGQFVRDEDNWPLSWTFETMERKTFLKTISSFSGIHYLQFGKLLTPLVQGVRVIGPFQPEWGAGTDPHLVLIDGEGLGHTSNTVTSLPTHVTSLFEKVDVIVLVDNAKSPMQAMPREVLETVVAAGYSPKLYVCFTHFEGIHGDNFSDRSAREDHVRNSLDQAISALGAKTERKSALHGLKKLLEARVFFVSRLDERITTQMQDDLILLETRSELLKMLATIEGTHALQSPQELKLTYDERMLFSYIRKAIKAFRDHWQGRLNLQFVQGVLPEHWGKVKALARRPAFLNQDEYTTLRPVADLIKELNRHIRQFLLVAVNWNTGQEEMQQDSIDAISREVYPRLLVLIRKYIITEPVQDWRKAYEYQGRGSARVRSFDIDNIFSSAAPFYDTTHIPEHTVLSRYTELALVDPNSEVVLSMFTTQVIEIVKEAIQASGSKVINISVTS